MRFSAKLGKNVRFSAILFKVILRISAKVVSLLNEIVLIWQKEYLEENCTRRCYSGNGNVTERLRS